MSLQARYKGQFQSVAGVLWTVEILQDSTTWRIGPTEELIFDGEDPLIIEWGETDKEEPLKSSAATLNVISPSDRKYTDLYTVNPKGVALRVRRDGALYWFGCLDPEQYEEPYEWRDGYTVTLTFTDFGILDRLKWNGEGLLSVRSVVESVIAQTGAPSPVLTENTSFAEGDRIGDLFVLADNFYDEEREPLTLAEVVTGALQPLGLWLVQTGGQYVVYDIGAVLSKLPRAIEWAGDSQTLSVDKTVNAIKISFSPYGDKTVYDGAIETDDVSHSDTCLAVYMDNNSDLRDNPLGFVIHYNETADNLPLEIGECARLYRIVSEYSGSDEAGVAAVLRDGIGSSYGRLLLGDPKPLYQNGKAVAQSVIVSPKVPVVFSASDRNYSPQMLRVSLDVLFDTRYNPFEQASKRNEEGNYDEQQNWCNFAYIPAKLTLYSADGTPLSHYSNRKVMESNHYQHTVEWLPGASEWGEFFLCYYNNGDRKTKSGFDGWATNRDSIGYYRGNLPRKLTVKPDGEYIPMPAGHGGWLQLEIGSNAHTFDYKREVKTRIFDELRWLLYKNPKIEVAKFSGQDIDPEDIEYEATVQPLAEEDLQLDTICGTTDQHIPSAKGLYLRHNLMPVTRLSKGLYTAPPEYLTLGTLQTQYSQRRDILSGEACICPMDTHLTDINQPGKHFTPKAMVVNAQTDIAELTAVEIVPDDYDLNELQ